MPTTPLTPHTLLRYTLDAPPETRDDQVATEEPLEIRLNGTPWQIAMRTPGADEALVLGLLRAEGAIQSMADVAAISHITDPTLPDYGNVMEVTLNTTARGLGASSQRMGAMTSACGVCGKTLLDTLATDLPPLPLQESIPFATLATLPDRLREHQTLFRATGAIHAAALFTVSGELLALAEDVGRHNAVDKVIGALLREGVSELPGTVLQVSGRTAYEIVQKAWRAGVPIVAAVGAPSSLAVETADRAGITLVGFLRGDRGNVYTHAGRIT